MNRRSQAALGVLTVAMMSLVGLSLISAGDTVVGGVIAGFGALRAVLLVRDLRR